MDGGARISRPAAEAATPSAPAPAGEDDQGRTEVDPAGAPARRAGPSQPTAPEDGVIGGAALAASSRPDAYGEHLAWRDGEGRDQGSALATKAAERSTRAAAARAANSTVGVDRQARHVGRDGPLFGGAGQDEVAGRHARRRDAATRGCWGGGQGARTDEQG